MVLKFASPGQECIPNSINGKIKAILPCLVMPFSPAVFAASGSFFLPKRLFLYFILIMGMDDLMH